jgi:hypothetical protein
MSWSLHCPPNSTLTTREEAHSPPSFCHGARLTKKGWITAIEVAVGGFLIRAKCDGFRIVASLDRKRLGQDTSEKDNADPRRFR